MFAGQGGQYYRMGQDLHAADRTFRRTILELDEVAGSLLGQSVVDEIFRPDRRITDAFDRTLFTHPAIFMVEYALARALAERGVEPDVVLGCSLGSFVAAVVAGCLSAERGLEAVIRQAQAFERHVSPGVMIAVLARPELYYATPRLRAISTLAALNFSGGFVLSCAAEREKDVAAALGPEVATERLPVSHGFHSALIEPAADEYRSYLAGLRLGAPQLPFACCMSGGLIDQLEEAYFWSVARKVVRFQETILALESGGAAQIFVDLGPSGSLANLVKYCLSPSSRSVMFPTMKPHGATVRNIGTIESLLKRASEASERFR